MNVTQNNFNSFKNYNFLVYKQHENCKKLKIISMFENALKGQQN